MPSLDAVHRVNNNMENIETQHTFRLPTEPVAQEPKRTSVFSLMRRRVETTSTQSKHLTEAEALRQLEQNRPAAQAAANRISFIR